MFTCEQFRTLLRRYVLQELEIDETLSMSAHLDLCHTCDRAYAQMTAELVIELGMPGLIEAMAKNGTRLASG